MSFISIFKKIGTTLLGIEHVAAPVLSLVVPGAAPIITELDGIFQRLQTGIVTVEANNPVDGQGSVKADAVTADFNAGLDLTQSVLAMEGKKLTYDAAALQTAIASQVAALNAMAVVKASFKVVPITSAPITPVS